MPTFDPAWDPDHGRVQDPLVSPFLLTYKQYPESANETSTQPAYLPTLELQSHIPRPILSSSRSLAALESNQQAKHNLHIQLEQLEKSKAALLAKIDSLTGQISSVQVRESKEQNLTSQECQQQEQQKLKALSQGKWSKSFKTLSQLSDERIREQAKVREITKKIEVK
ncbi:hypothetical protein L873DRAFT_1787815 [Choiromyces venosus 120613-1]|uniref:Uncharacterized protein n=1 Tax=Choiromyces venosus 120613-1 TaxID=1336337 RepID=A0A3N4JYD7_9PEZI|nr:hypothetical protein L873DRAFT_1787815 [Choiromyces venosus 120613-1]